MFVLSTLHSTFMLWSPVPQVDGGGTDPSAKWPFMEMRRSKASISEPLCLTGLLRAELLAVNDKQLPSPH